MKATFILILILAAVGTLTYGDEARKEAVSSQIQADARRLEAARKLAVPLPKKTRYDHDPKARKVYFEEYAAGYRTILAAVDIDCHMGVLGPYFHAYRDGWADGREQAHRDHPEKVYEMLGIEPPKKSTK